MTEPASYLTIKNLSVRFDLRSGPFFRKRSFFAIKDISLNIRKHDVFCLIGESGSGKSTLMWTLLGMHRFFKGEINYKGGRVERFGDSYHRRLISDAQMVFQDPVASLNPHLTLGRSIEEPMRAKKISRKTAQAAVAGLAEKTGLPADILKRKPTEASIGQNQRACIARALSVKPEILFLDEPLTALDPIVQTRVKKLLMDMKDAFGLTYFLVTHDLGFAKKIGTAVAVMYLGRIVEQAPAADFFSNPRHPYSQALLSGSLSPFVWQKERIILEGEIPSPHEPPKGCVFHPRCRNRMPVCDQIKPACRKPGKDHLVYCHMQLPDVRN
ncbi:MAG: ABC transporter ATP-binding protein [Proteobacteria bacterium]|nr:ABC transporter ATP-binding protein [Pseudomonadota bacterium]